MADKGHTNSSLQSAVVGQKSASGSAFYPLDPQKKSAVTVRILPVAFRIGTVRYNWPMSAHASQAFSIAHCTDSEDLPSKFPQLHFTRLSTQPHFTGGLND